MTSPRVANVLVVDDEPHLRELLVDTLAGPAVHVTAAGSGREAMELAEHKTPDLVVADLCLGDCTGLTVIDQLRQLSSDLPAVVITGNGDARSLSEASRCKPVELMTKPLDLDRLRQTIHTELARRHGARRLVDRTRRLRRIARKLHDDRSTLQNRLDTTCAELAGAYRNLTGQMTMQEVALSYQNELLAARNDDDVFRSLFRLFVQRSGPLFGAALVCDANAQLNMIGRFGVPLPDEIPFCDALVEPLIDAVLVTPQCMIIDAGEHTDMFDPSIHRFLPGLSILVIPLIPGPGELIGLVALYRKGEQPFTDHDVVLGEMVVSPTAIAIRRND